MICQIGVENEVDRLDLVGVVMLVQRHTERVVVVKLIISVSKGRGCRRSVDDAIRSSKDSVVLRSGASTIDRRVVDGRAVVGN